jgi:hypothetical protein
MIRFYRIFPIFCPTNVIFCTCIPNVLNNKALTNKFAGLFIVLSTFLLCFIVEVKGVKSNYFGMDIAELSSIFNNLQTKYEAD